MNYEEPQNNGYELAHLCGRNADADTGAAEDVWDVGGLYTFPAAAAETSIVSDSADDDAEGTGALTVEVFGLDANYLAISEVAALNGATPVVLTAEFLRVNRVKVLTAGSGETNAGNIQVLHGATVLAQVTASMGESKMAIYSVPAGYKAGWLSSLRVNLGRAVTSIAELELQVRDFGGVWRVLEPVSVSNTVGLVIEYAAWLRLAPKTDVRLRCMSVSANNTVVNASVDILLAR